MPKFDLKSSIRTVPDFPEPGIMYRDITTLLADAEEGDPVPRELFDIIAEVILWSAKVRERVAFEKENTLLSWDGEIQEPPGEDLTHYPGGDSPLEQQRYALNPDRDAAIEPSSNHE